VLGVLRGRSRLRLGLALAGIAVVLVAGVGYAAVRGTSPQLRAEGPTGVTGTEASATFSIADRTIRQVRYQDRGTLDYRFVLVNADRLPVVVTGIDPRQHNARLFGFVDLRGTNGGKVVDGPVSIPAHGSREVHLLLHMGGCESLSARAGSFASSVLVRTERLGISAGSVRIRFPEELHTGSPREAFCPNSTAKSRPAG
jgi:hypothetical protein